MANVCKNYSNLQTKIDTTICNEAFTVQIYSRCLHFKTSRFKRAKSRVTHTFERHLSKTGACFIVIYGLLGAYLYCKQWRFYGRKLKC